MPTALQLAPYVPVSQSHTPFKPWWHNNLCCGLFDLALAAHLANNVKYTNIAICKQVEVLLEYAVRDSASDGKVFSQVGEFFNKERMLEFAEFIIEKSKTDERLHLFSNIDASLVHWSKESGLEDLLNSRQVDDYIVFPYEPAYTKSEQKFRDKNGYHFLHFGLILPGFTNEGKLRVLQTSRGRTVKKPVYNPWRLYHTATAYELELANEKTIETDADGNIEHRGYKWMLQFPWRKYKGVKAKGFSQATPPKFSPYEVIGTALKLKKKED